MKQRVRATGLLTDRTSRCPLLPPLLRTGDGLPRVGSCASWTLPDGASTPSCGPSSRCTQRSGRRWRPGWLAPGREGCQRWRCRLALEPETGFLPLGRNPPFWWRSRRRPSPAHLGTSEIPQPESLSPRRPHPMCSPARSRKTNTLTMTYYTSVEITGRLVNKKYSCSLTSSSSISVTTLPGCRQKENGSRHGRGRAEQLVCSTHCTLLHIKRLTNSSFPRWKLSPCQKRLL